MNELNYEIALKIIKKAEENGFEACIKTVNGKPVIRIYDDSIIIGGKNGSKRNN